MRDDTVDDSSLSLSALWTLNPSVLYNTIAPFLLMTVNMDNTTIPQINGRNGKL